MSATSLQRRHQPEPWAAGRQMRSGVSHTMSDCKRCICLGARRRDRMMCQWAALGNTAQHMSDLASPPWSQ